MVLISTKPKQSPDSTVCIEGIDYFYVMPEDVGESQLFLRGAELHHLKRAVRKKIGDIICAVDGEGGSFTAEIISITDTAACCDIKERSNGINEPRVKLTLGMGLLKGRRLESALNSCVQLSLSTFVPLLTRNVVHASVSETRLQKVALSAMKQTKRSRLTEIIEVSNLEEFLRRNSDSDLKVIALMNSSLPRLTDIMDEMEPDKINSAALLVGPEGDFSAEEVVEATGKGFRGITLGQRRLRSETAAVAATSILMERLR